MSGMPDVDAETPLFAIAVAAELSAMHPQTLRQYDKLGLAKGQRVFVSPTSVRVFAGGPDGKPARIA